MYDTPKIALLVSKSKAKEDTVTHPCPTECTTHGKASKNTTTGLLLLLGLRSLGLLGTTELYTFH